MSSFHSLSNLCASASLQPFNLHPFYFIFQFCVLNLTSFVLCGLKISTDSCFLSKLYTVDISTREYKAFNGVQCCGSDLHMLHTVGRSVWWPPYWWFHWQIVETMPHTERVQNFVEKLGNFYELVDEPPPFAKLLTPGGRLGSDSKWGLHDRSRIGRWPSGLTAEVRNWVRSKLRLV